MKKFVALESSQAMLLIEHNWKISVKWRDKGAGAFWETESGYGRFPLARFVVKRGVPECAIIYRVYC
jgi:hypothetical protein